MASSRRATKPSLAQRYSAIYRVVAAIPKGAVASYGEVAARAGLPRGARLVGRALAECPGRLPWHRVLNAAGRVSLPRGSPSYAKQVQRLEAEGIEVRSGRVPRRYFHRDAADLDALLWGPATRKTERSRPSRRAHR